MSLVRKIIDEPGASVTLGDHVNTPCPWCGRDNHYIGDGVRLRLGQIRIVNKPCFYCKRIVTYELSYEIRVKARALESQNGSKTL